MIINILILIIIIIILIILSYLIKFYLPYIGFFNKNEIKFDNEQTLLLKGI
jgi:hypothetical protein